VNVASSRNHMVPPTEKEKQQWDHEDDSYFFVKRPGNS